MSFDRNDFSYRVRNRSKHLVELGEVRLDSRHRENIVRIEYQTYGGAKDYIMHIGMGSHWSVLFLTLQDLQKLTNLLQAILEWNPQPED